MIALRPATIEDVPLLRHWDEQPHVIESGVDEDWGWEIELARARLSPGGVVVTNAIVHTAGGSRTVVTHGAGGDRWYVGTMTDVSELVVKAEALLRHAVGPGVALDLALGDGLPSVELDPASVFDGPLPRGDGTVELRSWLPSSSAIRSESTPIWK